MFGGIFRFVKRQVKTKTGRYALGIVGGFGLNTLSMNTMGVGIDQVPFAGGILNSIFCPEVASTMLGFAYLRDQKAKEQHG